MRPADLNVTAARMDEVASVMAILDEAARWLLARGIRQWKPGMFTEEMVAASIAQGEVYLVRQDRREVGTVTVSSSDPRIWPDRSADAAYVHRLAIRRAFGGLGYGRAILEWVEGFARSAGKKCVRLDCVADNAGLRHYYEQAGYAYAGGAERAGFRLSRYEKPLLTWQEGAAHSGGKTSDERWPKIVGVVNITEDSFSDGGLYLKPDAATEHALRLVADGADVVDLGPASSHPDAKEVSPEEEVRRLAPALDRLSRAGIAVSVDSFQPETQRYAASRGVAYVNDIQGFPVPTIYPDLARAGCKLVVMHSVQERGRATRVSTDSGTIFERIINFFEGRLRELERGGIDTDRLILDPGMGYFLGDNPEPSVVVLRRLANLKRHFRLPVWLSVSRKSFLGRLTGREVHERGPATLAAELHAVQQGVDYIRTHDVRALKDALMVLRALE